MTPQQLTQIKTTLANDLDIVSLPEFLRDEIISKIASIVVVRITKETAKRLSDDGLQKLNELRKKGDVKYLQQFLEESIPDYEKLLASVIEDTISKHKAGVSTV